MSFFGGFYRELFFGAKPPGTLDPPSPAGGRQSRLTEILFRARFLLLRMTELVLA
jgi:hypothetical protein